MIDVHPCPDCGGAQYRLTPIRLEDGTGSLGYHCTDCDARWAAFSLPPAPHAAATEHLEGSG